jgi:hypothetical protein
MAASVRGVAEHGGEECVASVRRERLVTPLQVAPMASILLAVFGRLVGLSSDGEGLGMARIHAQIRDPRSDTVQEI